MMVILTHILAKIIGRWAGKLSRQTHPSITLGVYSHAVQPQTAPSLGEKLAAFMRRDNTGCDSVASGTSPDGRDMDR